MIHHLIMIKSAVMWYAVEGAVLGQEKLEKFQGESDILIWFLKDM